MSQAGDRARRIARQGARDGLREWAEAILRRSDADIPIGDPAVDPDPSFRLVNHGSVSFDETGLVATIHYDGPYAAWQHENQHARHPRGGKAKFLEDAAKVEVPNGERLVAGRIRARVKRGH